MEMQETLTPPQLGCAVPGLSLGSHTSLGQAQQLG